MRGLMGFDGVEVVEGFEGVEEDVGVEGFEGAIGADEEDEEAAIHISLDGYDAMGIGYMALWGFRAKCGTG